MIILASASPRRSALLDQIGIAHRVCGVDIDESRLAGESPEDYVRRLALAKARAGAAREAPGAVVLGADTAVVLDDEILQKPSGAEEAVEMLLRLSGRSHIVLTAVAVVRGQAASVRVSSTRVTFREIGRDEALAYWATGEPRDKAGGYAAQGLAAVFISRMEGSYSGVVGLPLYETAELLSLPPNPPIPDVIPPEGR